jgi:hypothetical protein
MSIAPVQSVPPIRNEQSETTSVQTQHTPTKTTSEADEARVVQPVSGTLSNARIPAEKIALKTYEIPEDVVEVQQDPDIKNQVIVQYLDPSKNVVLQVPSKQELSVERGIAAESEQAAKLRATERTTAAASEGAKTHGD